MSVNGDYITAKDKVLRAALNVATHNYDAAEDPGWQAEMDSEMLDEAVVEMAAAIEAKKADGK